MQTYEAIKILRKMRNLIPEDELHSIIDVQKDAAALDEAIEAFRVKIGFPPRLPGYITLAKTRKPTVKKLLKMQALAYRVKTDIDLQLMNNEMPKITGEIAFYLSFKTYTKLSTRVTPNGTNLCSKTDKTCYDKPEPLLCGLPVIYGDEKELGKKVYLITLKRI